MEVSSSVLVGVPSVGLRVLGSGRRSPGRRRRSRSRDHFLEPRSRRSTRVFASRPGSGAALCGCPRSPHRAWSPPKRRRDALAASLLTIDSAEEDNIVALLCRVSAARIAKPAPRGDISGAAIAYAASRRGRCVNARTANRPPIAATSAAITRQPRINTPIGADVNHTMCSSAFL